MTPRPLRNPREVTPIWKGAPVGAARTRRKAALAKACGGDKALARKLWKDRKTAPTADELEALLTEAEQMGAES